MKFLTAVALGAAASTTALGAVLPQHQQQQHPLAGAPVEHQAPATAEKYLIELAPYETRWVTEEEKWALKLVRPFHRYLSVLFDKASTLFWQDLIICSYRMGSTLLMLPPK